MPALELSEIQRWFQTVVTHPDGVGAGAGSDEALAIAPMSRDDLESVVTRSGKLSAQERLSIYAHAYYARLIECLGESFPVLKQALGEDVFNGFAFGYLQEYPSRSYTLARLADRFVQYLTETRPDDDGSVAGWPDVLIDLANLEWTIGEVFDGPGIECAGTLNAEDFLEVPPEKWAGIRLKVAPCLRLLETRFPVNAYYTAVRQAANDSDPAVPAADNAYVAITRRDYIVRRHDLTCTQYHVLEALQNGHTIGGAIEFAAQSGGALDDSQFEQLPQWFGAWTRNQFFVSFDVT